MINHKGGNRRKLTPVLTLGAAAALAVTAGGCTAGMRKALGVEKVAPDEFKVVTQAPLVIPPDFNLRPPEPGEARAQDMAPSSAARSALLGPEFTTPMSAGERALVVQASEAAGGTERDIRTQVELEGADVSKKSPGFADRVMFWNDGPKTGEGGQPAAVDSQAEADRLAGDASTGGKPVVIEPKRTGVRLPGL
jgi:hypothetical protein